jgi:hypothetical protein
VAKIIRTDDENARFSGPPRILSERSYFDEVAEGEDIPEGEREEFATSLDSLVHAG